MKKKTKYNQNMPAGELTRVRDFLPPPAELAAAGQTVKVTLSLNKQSVDFFKRTAQQNHTKYQKMIREVLDRYAGLYQAA